MANVQRPKNIRVGVRTYGISYLNDEQWEEGGHDPNERGVCNNVLGMIYVLETVGEWAHDEPQIKEILWHEAMHAVASTSMAWNVWDMLDKANMTYDDMEEYLVGGWSPVQLKMMHDNPEFVKWVMA